MLNKKIVDISSEGLANMVFDTMYQLEIQQKAAPKHVLFCLTNYCALLSRLFSSKF